MDAIERLKAQALAEAILRERGPLTLLELAVAVRDAGFPTDDRKRLIECLRSGMRYHNARFREKAGAWEGEVVWGAG